MKIAANSPADRKRRPCGKAEVRPEATLGWGAARRTSCSAWLRCWPVFSTLMVITRAKAVHALLYLVVSLLAVALVFYGLGAPFVAALEVIIYAGAIMVLFLFALMLLNLGPQAERQERGWLRIRAWVGPGLSSLALLTELVYW